MTKLYIHADKAAHFLRWELPLWAREFELVDRPSADALLLSFGPDVLDGAAALPASSRFAVLFPGFSFNPVRDLRLREHQRVLLAEGFRQVFINPGPLEIAYGDFGDVSLYPFSVDTELVGFRGYRRRLDSLLHVSFDNPQKDWRRSEAVMAKTGLRYAVYPPRNEKVLRLDYARRVRQARLGRLVGRHDRPLPLGYVSHRSTVRQYRRYDGFVHVARDVRHPEFIDGKYTAAFIEAGVSGSVLFWHDTWGLGNGLTSVIELPESTEAGARRILEVRQSADILALSRATREEMMDVFTPQHSVRVRAARMRELIE